MVITCCFSQIYSENWREKVAEWKNLGVCDLTREGACVKVFPKDSKEDTVVGTLKMKPRAL